MDEGLSKELEREAEEGDGTDKSKKKMSFHKTALAHSGVWCCCCKGAGISQFLFSSSKQKESAGSPRSSKSSPSSSDGYSPHTLLDGKLQNMNKIDIPNKNNETMTYPPMKHVLSNQKTSNTTTAPYPFKEHFLKDGHDWEAYTRTFTTGSLGMKLNIHPDASGCFVHHVALNSQADVGNVQVNDKIVQVGRVAVNDANAAMLELKKQPRPIVLTFHTQTKLDQILQAEKKEDANHEYTWVPYSVSFGPGPLGMKLNIHKEAVGCFVHHVDVGSAAGKANVCVNERIVAVGGVTVINAVEALAELKKQPRPIVLTFHKQEKIGREKSKEKKNSQYAVLSSQPAVTVVEGTTVSTVGSTPSDSAAEDARGRVTQESSSEEESLEEDRESDGAAERRREEEEEEKEEKKRRKKEKKKKKKKKNKKKLKKLKAAKKAAARNDDKSSGSSGSESESSGSESESSGSEAMRRSSRRSDRSAKKKTVNVHLARVESKFKMKPSPVRKTWQEKMEMRKMEAAAR